LQARWCAGQGGVKARAGAGQAQGQDAHKVGVTWGMWATHVGSLRAGEGCAHRKDDVTLLSSPHRCWECAGEDRERTSVRVRAVQCAEVGATVSTKAGRRVDVYMVVQGNRGKDEGGCVRACRARRRGEGRRASRWGHVHRRLSIRACQEDKGRRARQCRSTHARAC
jgi:hypothetical protein